MSPKFNLDLTPEEGILLLTGARLLDKLVAGIRIQSRDRDELISEVISKVASSVPPALNKLSGEIADAIVEAVAGQNETEVFEADDFNDDDETNSCSYPMYSVEKLLPVIEQAVSTKRTLTAEYYSFAYEAISNYTLNPFAMLQDGMLWKLIAFCRERGQVMVFRVDRIKSLSETGGTFAAPDGFNPQQHLPFAG